MNYTVGLDFGTHQTKCCVEERDGRYEKFWFVQFANSKGKKEYCLPSVVKRLDDGRMEYGFINSPSKGKVYRYFKQATFNPAGTKWNEDIRAAYVSVWYLTYLLLCLKKSVAQYFNINIGIPTDSTDYSSKKSLAVGILNSAYYLAEDVYKEDIRAFLNATVDELARNTKIVWGDEAICKKYGIKAFPEAWACLRPLMQNDNLSALNLMIDIGGGTTDISLFNVVVIKKKGIVISRSLNIYYYTSINKGLNYLSAKPIHMEDGIPDPREYLDYTKLSIYESDINRVLSKFMNELEFSYRVAAQGVYHLRKLDDAIKNKHTIYVGGGSTFSKLVISRPHFSDKRLMETRDWKMESIQPFRYMNELCPILSTSYGLAISHDEGMVNSKCNLHSLFDGIRLAANNSLKDMDRESGYQIEDNLYKDWDALK